MINTIAKIYRQVSLLLLHIVLIFLFLNIIAYMGFRFKTLIKEHMGGLNPVYAKYGEAVYRAYPGWNKLEINQLLQETWSRPLVYESVTQFKERPFRGKYVNVDKNGFRYGKKQGPWPPKSEFRNVFVFGGSTTFGYGLPDQETIPSYLQEKLNRKAGSDEFRVYNFGQGYYYSTQEMLLFQKLLLQRFKPEVAVFIDGLNEFYFSDTNEFLWSHSLEHCAERDVSTQAISILRELPLGRAMQWLVTNLVNRGSQEKEETGQRSGVAEKELRKVIDFTIDRYKRNQKLIRSIAGAYGVRVLFIWQPIPCYKIDPKSHPFASGSLGKPKRLFSEGYQEMEKRKNKGEFNDNFIWAADLQEGLDGSLYVDEVHYSALLCKELADYIIRVQDKLCAAS